MAPVKFLKNVDVDSTIPNHSSTMQNVNLQTYVFYARVFMQAHVSTAGMMTQEKMYWKLLEAAG